MQLRHMKNTSKNITVNRKLQNLYSYALLPNRGPCQPAFRSKKRRHAFILFEESPEIRPHYLRWMGIHPAWPHWCTAPFWSDLGMLRTQNSDYQYQSWIFKMGECLLRWADDFRHPGQGPASLPSAAFPGSKQPHEGIRPRKLIVWLFCFLLGLSCKNAHPCLCIYFCRTEHFPIAKNIL